MNVYPSFFYAEQRGQIFSKIWLPEGYQEIIPEFYKGRHKEKLEEFAQRLENGLEDIMFGKEDIRLRWHEKKGLVYISIGASGGLDLNDNGQVFTEHNLGTKTSLATAAIAINYVNILLGLLEEKNQHSQTI